MMLERPLVLSGEALASEFGSELAGHFTLLSLHLLICGNG